MAAAFRVASLVALAGGEDAAIADHERCDPGWMEPRELPAALGRPQAMRSGDDDSIQAFVLGWDEAQPLAAIGDWLEQLAATRGERLLRVHGVATTAEGAYALQAVRHVVGRPAPVEASGSTRLRFVTLGLEPGDLLPPWPCGAAR